MRNLFIALCLMLVVVAGCSGLAGEPRIVSTLPPVTAVPTDARHPLTPPDIAAGAQIFAENCVRCHGAGGKGDGDLVASGQISAPPDFTDPATTNQVRPDAWYDIVTNGKIQNLMPPWKDALTEAQRWDVTMYAYTLADPPELVARGYEVFSANCVECHGAGGKGDGERAEEIETLPADLTNLEEMATLSRDNIFRIVTEGTGTDMPSFADELSEDDRHAVVAYVRTLGLSNVAFGVPEQAATDEVPAGDVQAPEATPEVASTQEANAVTLTITGQISSGTAGGSVPPDLPLSLFVIASDQVNYQQIDGNANADGSYSFADVPRDLSSTYVVTTEYRDRVFNSVLLNGDALAADAADGTLDLPITIYDLTEDADVIEITRFGTQVVVTDTSLQVTQVISFTNHSDRVYTTSATTASGDPISLIITLPPGAVVAGFPDNQDRYVVDQANFTVFDTLPVQPNEEHTVTVIYLIPYEGSAIIEQPINYALNAQVRLLLNPPSITLKSDQLPPLGVQQIGNTQYQNYGAALTLGAGDVLRYELSGTGLTGAQQADRNAPAITSNNLLPIVVAVLVIAGLLGGGLVLLSTRNRSGDQQVINILIRQIAELDADHDAGRIADTPYENQRAALKARLAALMERKK